MDLVSGVKSFLIQKFWTPVANESVYYNPFNTVVYAFLFGAAAVYGVFPLLKRLGLKIDRRFVIGVTPFIFLGGATRSLKDLNVLNTFLLETPFIYILMFAAASAVLLASLKLEKFTDRGYHEFMAGAGLLLLAAALTFFQVQNFPALLLTFIYFPVTGIIFAAAVYFLKPELMKKGFLIPVLAHFFDASTSAVAVLPSVGAKEKHVLAQFFVDLFGPHGMFLMKASIIVPVTYLIWNEYEGEKRTYYLLIVAGLGFALGTRNLLSMVSLS